MMFDDVCTFDSGLVDFALCRLRSPGGRHVSRDEETRWRCSISLSFLRNTRNYWHSVVSHLSFMMFPVSLCGKALEFRRGWTYFALMYSILRLTYHGIGIVPLCYVCSLCRVLQDSLFVLCTVNFEVECVIH